MSGFSPVTLCPVERLTPYHGPASRQLTLSMPPRHLVTSLAQPLAVPEGGNCLSPVVIKIKNKSKCVYHRTNQESSWIPDRPSTNWNYNVVLEFQFQLDISRRNLILVYSR